jgi:hypothetical protein
MNAAGDTIRTRWIDFKEGLNRTFWYLDQNRNSFPDKKKSLNDTSEAGGLPVLPGNYKVDLRLAGDTCSRWVEVAPDPRLENDEQALLKVYKARTELSVLMDSLQVNTQKLKRYRHKLEVISKLLELESEQQKQWQDSLKAMNKSIAQLEEIVYGKEVDGYYDQPETLKERYGMLSYYLYSNREEINQSANLLLEDFKKALAAFDTKLKQWEENEWRSFSAQIAEAKIMEWD